MLHDTLFGRRKSCGRSLPAQCCRSPRSPCNRSVYVRLGLGLRWGGKLPENIFQFVGFGQRLRLRFRVEERHRVCQRPCVNSHRDAALQVQLQLLHVYRRHHDLLEFSDTVLHLIDRHLDWVQLNDLLVLHRNTFQHVRERVLGCSRREMSQKMISNKRIDFLAESLSATYLSVLFAASIVLRHFLWPRRFL